MPRDARLVETDDAARSATTLQRELNGTAARLAPNRRDALDLPLVRTALMSPARHAADQSDWSDRAQ
jgi:hypothetical protein